MTVRVYVTDCFNCTQPNYLPKLTGFEYNTVLELDENQFQMLLYQLGLDNPPQVLGSPFIDFYSDKYEDIPGPLIVITVYNYYQE